MIMRLSQKLCTRVKLGRLQPQGLAESAIIDWSARSFRVGRVEYILLCNTGTLYSCVMPSKGINSGSQLVAGAMVAIRETMASDGWEAVFERFIAPSSSSVTFATALSRTITSSMNELEQLANWALARGDTSLPSVARELNDHLVSALAEDKRSYRTPKDVMEVLCAQLKHDMGSRQSPSAKVSSDAGKTPTAERSVAAIKTITKAIDDAQGTQETSAGTQVYQFKIALLGVKPTIWRRIQTTDCTLDKFHEHIQTAMGWTNSHLHRFIIDGECYGDPEMLDDDFKKRTFGNSRILKLSEILPKGKKKFRFVYEYDFGDDWEHEIAFEAIADAQPGERYPMCLDGARACPPEDSGGIWGYADLLEALADPKHEEHDEYMEWAGAIDPEAFDCQQATRRMRQGLPNWRT